MNDKRLEQKVGGFVLAGLILTGILIIWFGQFSRIFQTSYDVTARFPNASGVIKNSQVLYRGAKIGIVAEKPKIIDNGRFVKLLLRINSEVEIPTNAKFKIGTYGLLGDRFVDIVPPDQASGQILKAGDFVEGSENVSLGDMLEKFDAAFREMQTQLLSEDFITDFHASVKSAKEILERGNKFMAETEKARGPLYTLTRDEEMAHNMKQLIYNLKTHGILFYEDTPEDENKKKDSDNKAKVRNRK